jgi:hypothetical protein
MRFADAMEDEVRVRVARDEKRHLLELARKRGVTLSTLIRESVAEAMQRTAG